MKRLKFAAKLEPLVLSGEKVSTWRLFDDKDLSKNDEILFINKETGEEFAKAILTSVREKKLGGVTSEDYDGHEKYDSHEDMMNCYEGYYGDKVNDDTIVKIINFKLI